MLSNLEMTKCRSKFGKISGMASCSVLIICSNMNNVYATLGRLLCLDWHPSVLFSQQVDIQEGLFVLLCFCKMGHESIYRVVTAKAVMLPHPRCQRVFLTHSSPSTLTGEQSVYMQLPTCSLQPIGHELREAFRSDTWSQSVPLELLEWTHSAESVPS